MNKSLGEIRRKQEEAVRRQDAAIRRKEEENLTIGVDLKQKGSQVSKPEKSVKVNLSHYKLKTVLGRGGYGKVRTEYC